LANSSSFIIIALDVAVTETSDQYNLPIHAAAFRVINDIKDYNRVGGLKTVGGIMCASMCCQGSLFTAKSSYAFFN
jgi:hypothetical protein